MIERTTDYRIFSSAIKYEPLRITDCRQRTAGILYACLFALLFWITSPIGGLDLHAQQLYTPYPSSFKNVRANELLEPNSLNPVFQKFHTHKPVKVMLIGDSHTRGNYYPHSVESTLKKYFPTVSFAYYGINGAWARRFYEPDMIQRVANENPDLVIISFGTNEAHGSNFDQIAHHETLNTLTNRIRQSCKGVSFIITTPPGSFISKTTGSYSTGRGRHRRTHYTSVKVKNDRTDLVARSIVNYGHANRIAVWDIFTIAGGPTYACTNWRDAHLMAVDQIHYTAQGYQLQGALLGEAIYKAFLSSHAQGSQTRMNHEGTPREQKPYKSLKGF